MRNRSSLSTDSFARVMLLVYTARPMLARITMSDITIINSMSVNPGIREPRNLLRGANHLPVMVFGPIEPGALALRVHVEHVLAAPTRRIRLVLIGAQTPLVVVGHRVERNAPKEFELAAGRVVGNRDSLDERIEIRRITLVIGSQLRRRDQPRIDGVLELVDRGAYFPQVPSQLHFALTLRGHLRERQHR